MNKNLYVGNLSFKASEDELRQLFSQFGSVASVKIIQDRETGRSRGFAFVEMASGGDEAITGCNGTQLDGRALSVSEAKPREDRRGGGGGSSGGGGFRGRRF